MSAEDQGLGQSWEELFSEWLESKRSDGLKCPVCRSGNFVLGDTFKADMASTIDPVEVQVAYLNCDNCGYMMLFNAEKIGLRFRS